MEKLNGKLIVIEGATDGIGKTTQYNLLKEYLINNGYEVYTHHFPSYNTKHGALTEEYLKGNLGDPKELSPYFVHALYAIDRAFVYKNEIEPAIKEGKVILLDRYTTSSLMYQSSVIDDEITKKNFIEFMADYEYNKLGIKRPDNVIFLYSSFELAKKLREQRESNEGIEKDIHEMNENYLRGVYNNSLLVAENQGFDKINCEKNNNMKSKEEIHSEIKKLIKCNK